MYMSEAGNKARSKPSGPADDLPLANDAHVRELGGKRPAVARSPTQPARPSSKGPASDLYFEDATAVPPEDVTVGQVENESADSSISEERAESRLGSVLAGRYSLERLIAKGGMGRVYLATQMPLGRKVAVKLLISQGFDKEFRQRFFLEASTCARLVHRHIVTVHDYGEAETGELFMAMEYLDGDPLSKVISREVRLSSERTCQVALQVCRALRTAHKAGIVHRDLKPGNVMLVRDEDHDSSDFVKVLDFGLVKVFEQKEHQVSDLTRSGTWLGSPRYMAPEQIRCRDVDPRTDIYSLGVIMFHMIAGRPPFVGASSVEILEQHLRDPPPALKALMGDIDFSPELEVVIQRCMEKNAEDRYQSMDELMVDLKAAQRLVTGVSVHTEPSIPILLPDISGSGRSLHYGASGDAPPLPLSRAATETARGAPPLVSRTMAEISDSGLRPADPSLRGQKKTPVGLLAASAAALLLVVLAGFLVTRMSVPAEAPAVAAPAPEPQVALRLGSQPVGAEVYHDGKLLGRTPLLQRFEKGSAGETRTFVLKKEGFEDTTVVAELQKEDITIDATLRAKLAAVEPVEPATKTEVKAEREEREERPRRSERRREAERRAVKVEPAVETVASPPTPSPVEKPEKARSVDDVRTRTVDEDERQLVVDQAVPAVD